MIDIEKWWKTVQGSILINFLASIQKGQLKTYFQKNGLQHLYYVEIA